MNWIRAQLEWLRQLWRKPPPRLCAYCSGPMPKDAPEGQLYCSRTHKRNAQALRNTGSANRRSSRQAKITAAWALNSTYEDHLASCARKTANGGAYETLGDALQARRWLVADTGNENVSAYRCKVCGKFHLTSDYRKRSESA